MKKVLKITSAISIGLILILTSCKKVDAGKGTKVEHIISETGFTGIALASAGQLTFKESSETSVVVKTSDKVFDKMEITNKNGILQFDFKSKTVVKNGNEIEIIISAPNIDELIVSGSGEITADFDVTVLKQNAEFNISGSGGIKAKDLTCENLSLLVSGSGKIESSNLLADYLDANISGSGDILSSGTSANSDVAISGSGTYKGFNCISDVVNVDISGSGDCEVTANDNLDVNIVGSGNVYYKGTPTVSFAIIGSGSVIDAN